jgi:hypothetical protein
VLVHRFDPLSFRITDPSTGAGAFFRLFPRGSVGFDVDPKMRGIRMDDFLEQELGRFGPCLVVGDPPFGQASRLAVKFFNHAARWCRGIAMVLPRTFRKASVQNQLDAGFHLICEVAVPEDAFYFRGRRHSVSTTFQIWKRRLEPREKRRTDTKHPDFQFGPPDLAAQADLVVQRTGARAGRLHHDRMANPNSHYFIKGDVEQTIRRLDLAAAAANLAGTPTLAKSEIIEFYRADFRREGPR